MRTPDVQSTILLRLPTELIVAIFESASPSCDPDEFLAPIRLSQVCRSWRIFVHATPCLWTQLSLSKKTVSAIYQSHTYERDLELETNRQIVRDINALTMYLVRSKNRLLTLVIRQSYAVDANTPSERPEYFDKFRNSFIPALVAYIKRCRHLVVMPRLNEDRTIFTNTTPESKAIFEAINNSLNLEFLHITEQWIFGPHFSGKLVNRLSELVFENYEVFHDVLMSLDGITLRVLYIDGTIPWLKLLNVLERCNKLEDLSLVVDPDHWIDTPTSIPADPPTIGRNIQTIATLRELSLTLWPTSQRADSSGVKTPWSILDFLDLPVKALMVFG